MKQQYIINRERALTNEELQRTIPSAYSAGAWERVSEKYQHIRTSEIISTLAGLGYTPHSARQGGTRIEGKEYHTRHLITFKADHTAMLTPTLWILNSSDRSTDCRIGVGLFRRECLNHFLCTLGESYQAYRYRHVLKTSVESIHGQAKVLCESFPKLLETVARFKSIQLSLTERLQFAEEALKLRYSMGDSATHGPDRLLTVRRYTDKSQDLFSTLNVIQENLLQTNYARWPGEKTIRSVGLTKSMELNRGVWQLAEDFALAR